MYVVERHFISLHVSGYAYIHVHKSTQVIKNGYVGMTMVKKEQGQDCVVERVWGRD